MSRTIRRKNYPLEKWHLSGHEWCLSAHGGQYLRRTPLDHNSRAYQLAYWRLHSDGPSGQYGVPRHFRRERNRSTRYRDRQTLAIAFARGDDDAVFERHVKDAGWYWF